MVWLGSSDCSRASHHSSFRCKLLMPGSFGLTGYDAVSHMVEEMPNPHLNAPKTMVAAVLIGASSSFIFLICLLFSMQDVDLVNSSPAGALLETMYQATSSRAGAVCLQVRLTTSQRS
jgi:choline transport protein